MYLPPQIEARLSRRARLPLGYRLLRTLAWLLQSAFFKLTLATVAAGGAVGLAMSGRPDLALTALIAAVVVILIVA